VSPGSRCPRCATPIKPYDNMPVLGWLWLRGRCRACRLPISPMYPLIELATGLLFVAAFLEFGIRQATVKWLFFTCLLEILTVTDLRVRLLPDVVNWPGFAAGVAFLGLRGTFLTLLVGSLLGSFIGVGLVLALYVAGWRGGVAKRASRRGLGTERQLRWAIARQYQLPLGTFLGIGALAIVYGGP